MGSSDPGFPLPLPPGWVDAGEVGGCRAAASGSALLLCGPASGRAGAAGVPPVGDVPAEVVVLDREPVRCRGGVVADRTLLAVSAGSGRSLTVEHWRYPEGHEPAEAVAVVPTGAYARLAASCTAALRGRRGSAPPPAAPAGGLRASLRVSVLAGPYRGTGSCELAGGRARVELPDLDRPRDVPAAVVPGWLAGLVGLGPRPRAAVPGLLVTSRPAVKRLLAHPGADPDQVRAAFGAALPDGWARQLSAPAGTPVAHWRLELAVPAGGTATLEVLDAGGLWSLTPVDPELLAAEDAADRLDGEPVGISPLTPSAVWHWLSPLAA